MDRRRSLLMIAGTVAIALGAGQYLQSGSAQSSAAMAPVPQSAPPLRIAAGTPFPPQTPVPSPVAFTPDPPPAEVQVPPPLLAEAPECPVTLDLFADEGATLSLSLIAPCRPDQGLVLRHGGIAVTYRTNAAGSLFLTLPALDARGDISLRFADGLELAASAPVPDLAGIHRFALQWMEGDAFTLDTPFPVTALGEEATVIPQYALVVTLPDPDAPLAVEAAVTARNCGMEALALAAYARNGQPILTDLFIALPECDGTDGFVVLNNPLPDMKLAATE